MIVVSDSSPLIALARISRLDLLSLLYKRILIPAEVHHEVTVAGRDLPGGREVRLANWIQVVKRRSPGDQSLEQACEGLGGGNAAPSFWRRNALPNLFSWMNGRRVV